MKTEPFAGIPNLERLKSSLETLWEFVDPYWPGFTRRSFAPIYRRARDWLQRLMQTAGLDVFQDAAGNLIGRQPGSAELPPLLIGSHTDTVVGGGRFDGAIGVLGGLEAIRCLAERGIRLRHPLELIDFLAEEPTDFGISTIGSRGMVGTLTPEMLSSRDPQNQSLEQAMTLMGARPTDLARETRKPGSIAAYLELHIEQGPILDRQQAHLAAVTGIVGIWRWRVTFLGQPDHAGTTPMGQRLDPLIAASQFIIAVEEICSQHSGVVGTVGRIRVAPNAPNVVPGEVELTVDLRTMDVQLAQALHEHFERRIRDISATRKIKGRMEQVSTAPPALVAPKVLDIVEEACYETASRVMRLTSGAGHDANQVAKLGPVGMIFVPSRAGRSHCPEEWTDWEDISLGVQALARATVNLDEDF